MKNKENNFVSAVLYIRNAESYIGQFIEKLNSLLSENFKTYEIICVNDSSNDNSMEEIRKTAKIINGGVLILVTTGFYQGIETSMLAGVDLASGDFVFEFDTVVADYEFNLIMEVYNYCISGYDIVSASSSEKILKSSRLFYFVFNKYSKIQYKIQSENFRILSRRAINRINQMSTTIPYRKAIYANCGLKYNNVVYQHKRTSVPIHLEKSSYRHDLALDNFIIFTNAAYKIALLFAVIMMGFSFVSGLYTFIIYITGYPVAGWTPIMILVSIGLFGLFGILAIVIKYLSVIINLIFKKAKYVIGSIEKI